MKENEIKEYLDEKFESMAPNLLDNICSRQREEIKDEKELFGSDIPLFQARRRNVIRGLFATAAIACLIAIVLFAVPNVPLTVQYETAFMVVVDVNPSISIKFNSEGRISEVLAGNKDAKAIVKNIDKRVDENNTYEDIMNIVIDEIKKQGYLEQKKNSMLVTVVSDDSDKRKKVLEQIKKDTKKYVKEYDSTVKTIYQEIKESKEIREVAKKNDVSLGKAALCIKIAKANNENYDKLCEKSISRLAEDVEKMGIADADGELIYDIIPDEELSQDIDEPEEMMEVTEVITEEERESETPTMLENVTEETISETEMIESTKDFINTTENQTEDETTTTMNK